MQAEEIATYRTDLLEYIKYMFEKVNGSPFIVAPHHVEMVEKLERVVIGDITRLIINIPPRAGKTEVVVVGFVSWCMGNWPDSEFIHSSYAKRLAAANTYNIRAWMQNEYYREIFGPSRVSSDAKAKDEFKTVDGGCVFATGMEGTVTGYGAGKKREGFGGAIIIDDPHKPLEINSKIRREKVIDWFSGTLESRVNSPDTPIILVMQPLHINDLSGWLKEGGNGEEWDVLAVPAANDDLTESFWEEQFPIEKLRRLSESPEHKYVFAAQYMLKPLSIGGALIKGGNFGRYKIPPPLKWRAIFADTAQKTADANDYSVFTHAGLGEDGYLYILDVLRGKWEAPELRRKAVDFWDAHVDEYDSVLRRMYVEDKVSGTGLIQEIKSAASCPVRGLSRNLDKYARLCDVLSYIESGYVMIPESAPWVLAFTNECEGFTANDSHDYDDQVDTLIDGIEEMLRDNRKRVHIG